MYNEEGKIPDIKKGTYKAWYTYQQVKLEGNALSEEQINALDRLPGWTWRPRCLVKILQKDIDALLKKKESLSSTINSNLEVIKEQQQRIAEAEAEAETEAPLQSTSTALYFSAPCLPAHDCSTPVSVTCFRPSSSSSLWSIALPIALHKVKVCSVARSPCAARGGCP